MPDAALAVGDGAGEFVHTDAFTAFHASVDPRRTPAELGLAAIVQNRWSRLRESDRQLRLFDATARGAAMPKHLTTLALLTAFIVPAIASAQPAEGHADRSHWVEFMEKGPWQFKLHTGTCRLLIKDTAAKRARTVQVGDLAENATLSNLTCKPGKPNCVNEHASSQATASSPPWGALSEDQRDIQAAVLRCSPWLLPGDELFSWTWHGSNASSVSLSTASKQRFARSRIKNGIIQMPGNWTKFGLWKNGAKKGICRVRYLGADYIGTIEHQSTIGADPQQKIYRWSSSAHRYVETSNIGSGTKCRVRFAQGIRNGVHEIATFKHFDVLRAQQGHRWGSFTPGGAVPSDAAVVGTQKAGAVYACRTKHDFDGPKNQTMGTQYRYQKYDIGYFIQGTDKCVTPSKAGSNSEAASYSILRNPI